MRIREIFFCVFFIICSTVLFARLQFLLYTKILISKLTGTSLKKILIFVKNFEVEMNSWGEGVGTVCLLLIQERHCFFLEYLIFGQRFYSAYPLKTAFSQLLNVSKSCFAFLSECSFNNVFSRKFNHSIV